MDKIDNHFKRLIRMDDIRLFKLFEISYYTLISFILTLITANILENDKYMPYVFKTYDYNKTSIIKLSIDIFIDLIILVIYLYYLRKFLLIIPFIFAPLNKNYKPSMKDEVTIGVSLGSGLILYKSLNTIDGKLRALNKKFRMIFF
tara:strand:+ start:76 stop:513 length:438 start_codon:yes stop_codon:yes gene_type:complete